MTDTGLWQCGPGRVLSRDAGEFRLQVRLAGGIALFLVQRRPGAPILRPQAVYASGEAQDVRAAMAAAANLAAQMARPRRGRAEAAGFVANGRRAGFLKI